MYRRSCLIWPPVIIIAGLWTTYYFRRVTKVRSDEVASYLLPRAVFLPFLQLGQGESSPRWVGSVEKREIEWGSDGQTRPVSTSRGLRVIKPSSPGSRKGSQMWYHSGCIFHGYMSEDRSANLSENLSSTRWNFRQKLDQTSNKFFFSFVSWFWYTLTSVWDSKKETGTSIFFRVPMVWNGLSLAKFFARHTYCLTLLPSQLLVPKIGSVAVVTRV